MPAYFIGMYSRSRPRRRRVLDEDGSKVGVQDGVDLLEV